MKKLSKAQRKVLQEMHDTGSTITIIRCGPKAYAYFTKPIERTVRIPTLFVLEKHGWVESVSDPKWNWRDETFVLTDKAKALFRDEALLQEIDKSDMRWK